MTNEYCVTLEKADSDKLAKKADDAGVVCDLEYLQEQIIEWLNKDERVK